MDGATPGRGCFSEVVTSGRAAIVVFAIIWPGFSPAVASAGGFTQMGMVTGWLGLPREVRIGAGIRIAVWPGVCVLSPTTGVPGPTLVPATGTRIGYTVTQTSQTIKWV